MAATGWIFQIATTLIRDLATKSAQKLFKALTRQAIEDEVKKHLADLQVRGEAKDVPVVVIENSSLIFSEVVTILEQDPRFKVEGDLFLPQDLSLTAQPPYSDKELRLRLTDLQDEIARRKLARRCEWDEASATKTETHPSPSEVPIDHEATVPLELGKPAVVEAPERSPSPSTGLALDEEIEIELESPAKESLKLLEPFQPVVFSEPTEDPLPGAVTQSTKLSERDRMKRRVLEFRSRVRLRKVERGEI